MEKWIFLRPGVMIDRKSGGRVALPHVYEDLAVVLRLCSSPGCQWPVQICRQFGVWKRMS